MDRQQRKTFDILIVGAGPAGLSVAAECLYHRWGNVAVLEKGDDHNQTIRQYYPDEKRVDAAYLGQEAICAGVLCFRDTTKPEFLKNMEVLIRAYHPNILYQTQVDSIKKDKNGLFNISTQNQESFQTRYVVIAIGRMGKPNRPEFFASIPAKAKQHIHFDLRKIALPRKEVLVVGGGNTATEFALALNRTHSTTLCYRQKEFTRLNPMNKALLESDEKEGRLKVLRGTDILAIQEAEDGRPHVKFNSGESQVFDEIVYAIGGSSPVAFLQTTGIELDPQGNPKLSPHLESSIAGLFVAGELSVPPGKGSIIKSFNSGKTIVETILKREKVEIQPELNFVVNR